MGKDFVLLTGCASLDIVRDPLVHTVPSDKLFSFPDGFIPSRVACQWVIVCDVHAELFCVLVDRFVDSGGIDEFVRWDHGDLLVVVFPLVGSGWSRQCICWNISLSGNMLYLVIVFL